jgi:hypothetical protein
MSEKESVDRQQEAARSAGRAAGYCWIRFGVREQHCTRSPEHGGDHYDKYDRATLRALAAAAAPRARGRRVAEV